MDNYVSNSGIFPRHSEGFDHQLWHNGGPSTGIATFELMPFLVNVVAIGMQTDLHRAVPLQNICGSNCIHWQTQNLCSVHFSGRSTVCSVGALIC